MKQLLENIIYGTMLSLICFGIFLILKSRGNKNVQLPDIKKQLQDKPLPDIISDINSWLS
jgi:hypothetical protein